MKLRQSFATIPPLALALVVAPAALTNAGFGDVPGAERVSFAQGAPSPGVAPPPASDGVTEIARQRYQQGVKDFDAGKYEEARAAFLQAYALKRAPVVLLNIALSELRSTAYHADEAGNHFQQFLREATTATPEQRATAEKGLADAKKRAGVVVVTVDATGADVTLDGTIVGKSPLPDPVLVKPGKHTVFAQIQGKSAASLVDVKAGATATASLTTGVTVATTVPSPGSLGPSAPGSTGAPGGSGQVGTEPSRAQPYPPGSGGASPPPGSGASAGQEPGGISSGREPFGHWYVRKPLAWVGTGVTGVGLIMGVSASIAAGARGNATADHAAQIKAEDRTHPEFNPDRRKAICGDPDTGAGALPHYVKACAVIREDVSRYNTAVGFTVAGWVLFGVGLAGTAFYAGVDWYSGRSASETADSPRTPPRTAAFHPRVLAVMPIVSLTQQGIGVAGIF